MTNDIETMLREVNAPAMGDNHSSSEPPLCRA